MFGFFKRKQKDREFMMRLMTAAAEGEQRSKINAALSSLGIQLEAEEDNSQYCIKTTAAFVKKIVEEYGTDIQNANDDDIVTAGIFLFTVSNHITRVIGAPFEAVSSITLFELFSDVKSIGELTEYIPIIGSTYNTAAENTKIIDAIGQSFVNFLNEQQYSQFENLIKLYGICRANIKDA
jgi:hypothetical protein